MTFRRDLVPTEGPNPECAGLRPDDGADRVRGSLPANEQRRRLAVTGYLGRYTGQTRVHTASDLRVFLTWCDEHDLDPLDVAEVRRAQVEAFVRDAGGP